MGAGRTVWFGIPLVVLVTFILQVTVTDAAWGWPGGSGGQKSQAEDETGTVVEASRTAAFDMDSGQILANTVRGKELYEQSTNLMSGHTCWQKAYKGMETGCRDILNDETKKTRLALKLTDCFLMASGRPGLKQCANNVPTASCVRNLDNHQNHIFLAWFIDVAAMCHYMQSEDFKFETERAVTLLKDSAHKTQTKLDKINQDLNQQHSELQEHTEYIVEAQEILQKGQDALQASIEEGMGRIQETSQHVRTGLEDVHGLQKEVARQNEQLTQVMKDELSELQLKSAILANSLGNLYSSVESLEEHSKAGQEHAMQSLADLKDLHQVAKQQTKEDLKKLSHESLKVYDAFKTWQEQLGGTHRHLIQSATEITRNHDTILSKQSQLNKLIMEVLEAIMALQKGWLFESRALHIAGIYLGVGILTFLSTSTKKTRSARLTLYLGLFSTLVCEIYIVHYGIDREVDGPSKEARLWPPGKVWWLRSTFIAMASAFLLYTFFTYKDYKVLNYRMLADNADLINTIGKDLHLVLKEVKHLATRQANVENALGLAKGGSELEEDRTEKRTRFLNPRKPPADNPRVNSNDRRRVRTSPY